MNSLIKEHYNKRYYKVCSTLNCDLSDNAKKIKKILNTRKYNNVIVYMHAVAFEPVQRPQHFLYEFAKNGDICFFCDMPSDEFKIIEYSNNFFIVNSEEELISALRDYESVIMYITYGMQYMYKQFLKNSKIWFDILDEPKFLANYDFFKDIYKNLIYEADIISYSAVNLKKVCKKRKDAIYLPNGVNLEDFKFKKEEKYIDNNIEIIKDKKKEYNIIGYYGALEEWFDNNIIKDLLFDNKNFVVLIGKINIEKIESDRVFYTGKIDYNKLKWYSKEFDVAIIPFKINKITNSVSPVKFFEYTALNIPCVTTKINEMKLYKNKKGVYLSDKRNFNKMVKEAINSNENTFKIAKENTWKKRARFIEEKIKEIFNID